MRFLVPLAILAVAEILLLERLSEFIPLPAIALYLVAMAIVGVRLIRSQGWRTWQRVHEQLAQGQSPAAALVDHLLLLLAGVLFVIPGVITDLLGIILLIPAGRRAAGRLLAQRFRYYFHITTFDSTSNRPPADGAIDVESRPVEPQDRLR
jgi:UPF0716 protein FxsA